MAARVCSTCDLAYDSSYGGLCRACESTLRYSVLATPQLDVFQRAAEQRARATVAEANDSDSRIFANRLWRFVHAGLDYDEAVRLSGLKTDQWNLYVVEPGRFELLVSQGCSPALAAKILG